MIDSAELLGLIENQIRPLLKVRSGDFLDDGNPRPGYDCCGCSTYEVIVEDIEALIRQLAIKEKT